MLKFCGNCVFSYVEVYLKDERKRGKLDTHPILFYVLFIIA